MTSELNRRNAIHYFDKARRQAQLDQLSAKLTGRDASLLPFEAIRHNLRQQSPLCRGLQQVPLDEIVGSVGRTRELTRKFLPRNDSMRERWINVTSLAMEEGWPPIELYKVGGVYFVKDGNHRVSAARQLDYDTIEAYVWEFPADVEIGPEDNLDAILIRFGESNFMQKTHLNEMYPDHNIRFTTPGRYSELLAQIADLREKLSKIDGEEMPYDEAVRAWYEMVYLPTVQVIHDAELLKEFPGRTEADLFVWMSLRRGPLQEVYGEFDSLEDLARLLTEKYGENALSKVARQMRRLLGSDELPPLDEGNVVS